MSGRAVDPIVTPIAPMEAKLVEALPEEPGWQFEPKWDGFRAIAVRDGERVALWSKSGKTLGRYFPEILALLAATKTTRYIVDGEIILPVGNVLSFNALQQRLHPAASRIAKLSIATPAQLMLFDCLGLEAEDLIERPLADRRVALERFHAQEGGSSLLLSPQSEDFAAGRAWLQTSGGALDGIVAKRRDEAYRSGERAMLKVKVHRSADCVVGGIRRSDDGAIASLLLGLYDEAGQLNHVGFTSGLKADDQAALADRVAPHLGGTGFTGKAPGGPSRWNDGKEKAWTPLAPDLVVEVLYDQVTGDRLRHGTRLLRWRPDKAPATCTMDQLVHEVRPAELAAIV
ncbi:ATP-dependent DNA ligase [Sphingomonas montanisoli]|uniref:DNA ligase (ATP) n=1 Tax=Sphingomonas montanisoli TaxID=2606412 RepID=A0A5D9C218_9SPHN|nr:ATP-dependent DNA ligase [Sphingomonas montanisoli]TZG25784.1 ATP-dependent DNA ligase [Sphingomonas montanisoli]